jgi:hypothetical protein
MRILTMGRYLKEARHHIEKIQKYFDHAGPKGYSQAKYHYDELSNLLMRVYRSSKDKGDAPIIQALKKSIDPLMEQMRKREEENLNQR